METHTHTHTHMCVLHGDCKATGTMSDWLQ